MKYILSFIIPLLIITTNSCAGKKVKKYTLTKDVEASIISFRDNDHFSEKNWDKRGLVPSPQNVLKQMQACVYNAVNGIIKDKGKLTEEKIKSIIEDELLKTKSMDTEEREFLAETFYELSSILKIACKEILNELFILIN